MPRLSLLISLLALLAAAPAAGAHHEPGHAEDDPTWGGGGWEGSEDADPDDPGEDEPPPADPSEPDDPLDDVDDFPGEPWPDEDGGSDGEPELVGTPTVAGRVARLRTNGKAAIPRGAPKRVRAIIAAANRIAGKPYKRGGGHARLEDRGYDCSGAVGYALIRAGLQRSPMVSGGYVRWGRKGAGRWVTIYANKGHVYMEVAGLRLDTSAAGYGRKGVRWRPVTGKRRGFHARHPAGL